MNNQPYINAAGRTILQYLSSDNIVLDLHFILTHGKRLTKGMPYMLLEKRTGSHETAAIRLLNYQDYEGEVYLHVQDLQTNRCYNISWNMDYDGDYWLWSLSDFETLSNNLVV